MSNYERGIYLNKEFGSCCRFLAEMMEKYGHLVLRDILEETKCEPETWYYDAEGMKNRFEAYVNKYKSFIQKVA